MINPIKPISSNTSPTSKNHISPPINIPPPILIPQKLGIISTQRPAFLSLEKFSCKEKSSLVITSFRTLGKHYVRIIPQIGEKLNQLNHLKAKDISDNIIWPNGVTPVPQSMFGKKGLLVSGGFFIPGYSTGAVTFIDLHGAEKRELTKKKNNWFYHRTQLIDMNNNGLPDILTARAYKPIKNKNAKGELIWLENPGDTNSKWKEHLITTGPDVHFLAHDLNKNGIKEIISADFFSKKLRLIWKEKSGVKSIIIDDTIGKPFDIQLADINGNGKLELLVTNHEHSGGGVFAYEIPKDFKNQKWKRHSLLKNIKLTKKGPFESAPGKAVAFYPHKSMQFKKNQKPYILVSGDASSKVHLLIPHSNNSNNWNYTEKILLSSNCTIGQLAVGDTNGDGYTEIFVPLFEKNEIHTFTFKDSKVLPE